MYSLKLMVGIVICLCWLSLPMVYSQTAGPGEIPDDGEQQMMLTTFNMKRASLDPRASDMQKVVCDPICMQQLVTANLMINMYYIMMVLSRFSSV